jgi:hypothetical protein
MSVLQSLCCFETGFLARRAGRRELRGASRCSWHALTACVSMASRALQTWQAAPDCPRARATLDSVGQTRSPLSQPLARSGSSHIAVFNLASDRL